MPADSRRSETSRSTSISLSIMIKAPPTITLRGYCSTAPKGMRSWVRQGEALQNWAATERRNIAKWGGHGKTKHCEEGRPRRAAPTGGFKRRVILDGLA